MSNPAARPANPRVQPRPDGGSQAAPAEIPALTHSELLLLSHLGAGLTHKEIAGELEVSTRTVRRYLSELCLRFNVGTPVEVLVAALKAGVL